MREIILDGASWETSDDLYDSFFQAVGAPSWHGRNFNALRDSIETGQVNSVEVPYKIVITNFNRIGPDTRQLAESFVSLMQELSARGCPVTVETVNS